MNNQQIRFGLNYVPSKNWWYSWLDWDSVSIEEDLQAIASLGMDHIRVHCVWPIFQPNVNYVSGQALDRLHELLDIADKCSLDVSVAVLDGWLSGFKFEPAWMKNRNMFTDPAVVQAEKLLFSSISNKIGKHPRFMGLDLGNELGVMQVMGHETSKEKADKWNKEMLEYCEQFMPGKIHVNGVDHMHWFNDIGFSRRGLAATGSMTSLHTWIKFTGAADLYRYNETGCTHLAEYCVELAKAYHQEIDRKVWIQEFGASSMWMPAGDIPDFLEETIRQATTCANVWGFTWWCSHDISPEWLEFDPLEYDLGLLDVNNNVKPAGERMARMIKEYKHNRPQPIERTVGLVFSDAVFQGEGIQNYGWKLGTHFMDFLKQGIRPCLVLEENAADEQYLKSRGIRELITLP